MGANYDFVGGSWIQEKSYNIEKLRKSLNPLQLISNITTSLQTLTFYFYFNINREHNTHAFH